MEVEKRLNEMSINELVDVILKNPDRMDEVFRATGDLSELYDALESELLPDSIVFDDAEMNHNLKIREALTTLEKEPEYVDLELEGYELGLTSDDLREAEEELEEFYAEHPEADNRPNSQMPEGMSIEEYSEAMGVHINEFGEIIRPSGQENAKSDISPELSAWLNGESTPLKKREEQLVALEEEAKTISEAEALIDKQNAKEDQSIGE